MTSKISDLLKTVRSDLGLSQLELSRRSGVSKRHISNIETGFRKPSFSTLTSLMVVLNNEAGKQNVDFHTV